MKLNLTSEDIRRGLEALGLGRGMGLMAHSSLSAFGWVEGGAEAVIRALQALVGPEGTILMPSFNHGAIFREGRSASADAPVAGGPGVFDPLKTPTSNGRIPDTFWRMPGVFRSLNPTHAFAAWGRDAERYTANHHLTLTMGEDSPLGLLAREGRSASADAPTAGGWQANLGTTHHTTTAKHLAETMRRVPCLGYRTEAHPVRLPD
ncbi:MAG: AAC(3) family N-acetyltransferase, partial [Planctomycetes bacterium]|nr:AAC(3) family N-acetyltransferase [Planctomycetota bacterium]